MPAGECCGYGICVGEITLETAEWKNWKELISFVLARAQVHD